MNNSLSNASVMYVNRSGNACYKDTEILELDLSRKADETPSESVFEMLSKLLCRCEEQKEVYHYLTYVEQDITQATLVRALAKKYKKSERTYYRSIGNLKKGKVILEDNGFLKLNLDYDLSLFDLSNVKMIAIKII